MCWMAYRSNSNFKNWIFIKTVRRHTDLTKAILNCSLWYQTGICWESFWKYCQQDKEEMNINYLVGIDLGTSGVKVFAVC